MMYDWFNEASGSAQLTGDYSPFGWMQSHMGWAVGATSFGAGLTWILADIALILLIIYLWQKIQKK